MHSEDRATLDTTTEQCAICGGTGFTIVKTEDRNGKVVAKASTCDCRIQSRAARLLKQARIPPRYEHCDLSSFEFQGALGSLLPARMAACKFVEEFPFDKTGNGLLFIGPVGVGKTHLAVAIMKALILQQGVQCLFCDYRELMKEIQNSYEREVEQTELGVLRPILNAEVLLLDELAAVRSTNSNWMSEQIQFVINTRYNSAKPTLITTNYRDLPPGGVMQEHQGRPSSYSPAARANREETLGDRIGERMRSRLHEMCRIVPMQGEDYRIKYKPASFD